MATTSSRTRWSARAGIGFAIAGAVCLGGLVVAGSGTGSRPSVAKPRQSDPPLPDVASVAKTMALDHRSLAVAGVSEVGIASVDAALSARINSDWASFRTLLDQRSVAATRAGRPPSELQDGGEHTVASLRQDAASAQAAVGAWLESTRQAAIADLPAEQIARLNQLSANRDSGLPVEFRLASYSQAELAKLRDALSQRVRAAQLSEQLSDEATALITQYETADVLAARSRMGQVAP